MLRTTAVALVKAHHVRARPVCQASGAAHVRGVGATTQAVYEDQGGVVGPVFVPAAAGEEANTWFDLEEADLVRGFAEAARPCPTSKRLNVPVAEQRMRPERPAANIPAISCRRRASVSSLMVPVWRRSIKSALVW